MVPHLFVRAALLYVCLEVSSMFPHPSVEAHEPQRDRPGSPEVVNWLINSMKPQSKGQLAWDTCSLTRPISGSVRAELVNYELVKCVN